MFSHGKRLGASAITLLVLPASAEHDPSGRVAFVAGKKNGNAVWRNSAKRRMREIARELGAPWAGFDVVFIAKRSTTSEMYSKVLHQTKKMVDSFLNECN